MEQEDADVEQEGADHDACGLVATEANKLTNATEIIAQKKCTTITTKKYHAEIRTLLDLLRGDFCSESSFIYSAISNQSIEA